MAKHFFKLLAVFLFMIVLGLVGVSVVNYFDNANAQVTDGSNQPQLAK
jgi:hypothetical protein